jgi:hypothetical protein
LSAKAETIPDSMSEVESLLLERNYKQAIIEFDGLSSRIKNHQVKGYFVYEQFDSTIKWLKNLDEYHSEIDKVESNMSGYRASGINSIYYRDGESTSGWIHNGNFDNEKPRYFPYSQGFLDYLNNYQNSLYSKFRSLNTLLSDQEKNRLADIESKRLAKADQIKIEEKKRLVDIESKRLARENENNAKLKSLQAEIDRVDMLAKDKGFLGYSKKNVLQLIYQTQKSGDLGDYLNYVVGCHDLNRHICTNSYSKLRIIQVLDDAILYSFSEFYKNEMVNITVLTDKKSGKIYQEGQVFTNDFFVFTGMNSYTTVAGSVKTVPVFLGVGLE